MNAVNDLNCKLNNLLGDFSHCYSSTLSVLFQSYCMNVYGCQIWSYNINMFINSIPHGGKLSDEFGKLITELIINCYMTLKIVYLTILHWKKGALSSNGAS